MEEIKRGLGDGGRDNNEIITFPNQITNTTKITESKQGKKLAAKLKCFIFIYVLRN